MNIPQKTKFECVFGSCGVNRGIEGGWALGRQQKSCMLALFRTVGMARQASESCEEEEERNLYLVEIYNNT